MPEGVSIARDTTESPLPSPGRKTDKKESTAQISVEIQLTIRIGEEWCTKEVPLLD